MDDLPSERTSLVSKKWRNLCASLPQLSFDLYLSKTLVNELLWLEGSHAFAQYAKIFIDIVDQFLLSYKGWIWSSFDLLCIPEPGVIELFRGLHCLELVGVVLAAYQLDNVLNTCVKLESINLYQCLLPRKLCVFGSLKYLSLRCCYQATEIEFSASHLTDFSFFGKLFMKFTFCEVPNLKTLDPRLDCGGEMEYIFTQLVKDLPLVETLDIRSRLMLEEFHVMSVWTRLRTPRLIPVVEDEHNISHYHDLSLKLEYAHEKSNSEHVGLITQSCLLPLPLELPQIGRKKYCLTNY